jgi:hypothetical protein
VARRKKTDLRGHRQALRQEKDVVEGLKQDARVARALLPAPFSDADKLHKFRYIINYSKRVAMPAQVMFRKSGVAVGDVPAADFTRPACTKTRDKALCRNAVPVEGLTEHS